MKYELREKPVLRRRSLNLGPHRTSITMEDVFWERFKKIAKDRDITPSGLAWVISCDLGQDANLSSALRCFIIEDALAEIEALKR